MAKTALSYDDFIASVDPIYRDFVEEVHRFLSEQGCKLKVAEAKSGYVVSYNDKFSKKVVVNFVFRRKGLLIRIYGDHVDRYQDLVDRLPEAMQKAIEKAPVCKRLVDPEACNARCAMGYEFQLNGQTLQKCRYNCFMFDIDHEYNPSIMQFLQKEMAARSE